MSLETTRLWGFLGEEASKYRILAERWNDTNKTAVLELAAETLESLANEVLDGRVRQSNVENLARLARLLRSFGLPYKRLLIVRRIMLKYVEIVPDNIFTLNSAFEPIGLPA